MSSVQRYLTEDGLLPSDLWLDQPDAENEIERRLEKGRLSVEQAEKLAHFCRHGYLTLKLDLDELIYEQLDATVERLWRERPCDVAYAFDGPLKPMSEAEPERERRPPYRIADLHAACPVALDLYLCPHIFEYLRLILEDRAVATQSLYFEYGSRQPLHRDPVFVSMKPSSHLVASWLALEDIVPDCGPLTYVPGSHRLPYYEFSPGDYRFNHYEHGNAENLAMAEFEIAQCERAGLEVESFLPRRGECLIWHHSLLHGGSPGDEHLTRKSFVVHYTSMALYASSRQSIQLRDEGGKAALHALESFDVLGRRGCYGFDSPLRQLSAG